MENAHSGYTIFDIRNVSDIIKSNQYNRFIGLGNIKMYYTSDVLEQIKIMNNNDIISKIKEDW